MTVRSSEILILVDSDYQFIKRFWNVEADFSFTIVYHLCSTRVTTACTEATQETEYLTRILRK